VVAVPLAKEEVKPMYSTDDAICLENMAPLIIAVAPHGPGWLPGDGHIPAT
jgi:hypothetical protein